MMGTRDARNIYSNLALNKYLHTVAYSWISSTMRWEVADWDLSVLGEVSLAAVVNTVKDLRVL